MPSFVSHNILATTPSCHLHVAVLSSNLVTIWEIGNKLFIQATQVDYFSADHARGCNS